MKRLKDQADSLSTKQRSLIVAEVFPISAADAYRAVRCFVQTSDQMQKRALARPEGPVIATISPIWAADSCRARPRLAHIPFSNDLGGGLNFTARLGMSFIPGPFARSLVRP